MFFDFCGVVVSEPDFEAAKRFLAGEPDSVEHVSSSSGEDEAETLERPIGYRLTEIGYYEASEALFEAPDVSSLGAVAASALTHFFSHVAAVRYLDSKFHLLAGSMPQVIESLPFEGYVGQPEPFYGPETDHEAGALLRAWLGFEESLAILMVCWPLDDGFLLLMGSHGEGEEIYGDLNDVSGLFQEVETALNVLNNASTNG